MNIVRFIAFVFLFPSLSLCFSLFLCSLPLYLSVTVLYISDICVFISLSLLLCPFFVPVQLCQHLSCSVSALRIHAHTSLLLSQMNLFGLLVTLEHPTRRRVRRVISGMSHSKCLLALHAVCTI